MLIKLLTNYDLLCNLVEHIEINEIESLYLCNSVCRNTFLSSKAVHMLVDRFDTKFVESYYDFLIWYNHKYRRSHSFDNRNLHHLILAIWNNDEETVKLILTDMKLNSSSRILSSEYNNIQFETGRIGNQCLS